MHNTICLYFTYYRYLIFNILSYIVITDSASLTNGVLGSFLPLYSGGSL